jgi:hypothetical protein
MSDRHAGAANAHDGPPEPKAGLVVVQIDGLSRGDLGRLLAAGRMPTLARLIRDRRLEIGDWRPLLPPCTPASQAGILHGRNDGIPGFRWFEKDERRLIVANHPRDAAEIERRLTDGDGLLARDGASIGNLLTGDSPYSHLTMATIEPELAGDEDRESPRDARPLADRPEGVHYTIDPRAFVAIAIGVITEAFAEIRGARHQRRHHVRPRMRRGWRYAVERVLTNVPLRILSTELVRGEIRRGRPRIYVDFTGYDEVAHHCGPGRPDAARSAERIDRSIGRIVEQMDDAPIPYGLVVLSDHGQSLGVPFRQRYGRTLEEHIAILVDDGSYHGATDHSEYDDAFVRLAHDLLGRRGSAALHGLLARRPGTNHHRPSRILDSRGAPLRSPADVQVADVVVCASGNLGLIYLTSLPGRADEDAIERRYPGLIAGLVNHPGIDVVVVATERGLTAIGDTGTSYLDEGRVVGDDPLGPYGPLAAEGIRRVASFDGGGDLIVIGHVDPATSEVVSFEELVGSHGGLGGEQERPFLAAPPDWPRIEPSPIGSPAVHRQLEAWIADLPSLLAHRPAAGDRGGVSDAPAPAPEGQPVGSAR